MYLTGKVRIIACIVCLSTVLGCFMPAMAATQQAAVTTGNIKFRTGPGTEYAAQQDLSRGTQVVVLDSSGKEWWKISYNGQEGYAIRKYLKLTGAAVEATPIAAATATTLNATQLYASQGKDSIMVVERNTTVNVLEGASNDKWWRVSVDGQEGYIQRSYLKLTSKDAAGQSASSQGSAASSKGSTSASTKNTPVTVSNALAGKIAGAKSINKDTVGWIQVPNTNIDEPILYGANFYYASHNIHRKKSYDGVYPFYNVATKNIIVFGHNMRGSATIFHQLHHLQEAALGYTKCQSGQCKRAISSSLKDWYKSASGRTWDIPIFGTQKWEVFAMYEVKAKEPIATLRNNWSSLSGANSATVQKWIDGQISRSEIKFGVDVKASDKLMTLITCGTNYDSATANSRLFVFLKNVD